MAERASTRNLLLDKAREASTHPGVYFMRDVTGQIQYIGKAKNLRNRLLSYFQPAEHEIPRTELMVQTVADFDVILTETEAEALILECTLIKKHKPKFNVRLKDDKAYPYIRVALQEDFPRLEWTRKVRPDSARYFGPFPSSFAARQVLRLLTESFKLRDCSDNTFRHRSRPCILYQMDKCTAPCVGHVDRAAYREQLDSAMAVFEGRAGPVVTKLKSEMQTASEAEEYERAAELRDQVQALEVVTETQGVVEAGRDRHRDVIGLARKTGDSGAQAQIVILQIRGGKLVAVRHYFLENTDPGIPDAEILGETLAQHYVAEEKKAEKTETQGVHGKPNEILLPIAPTDVDLLEKTLGVTLRVPETKEDEQLIRVAQTNAVHSLEHAARTSGGHGVAALEDVQQTLELSKLPSRIECFDISNIQSSDPVASRVVFIDGRPEKTFYRKYKIKTVEGQNDFAMMKEVLFRRFSHTEEALPDLLMVDGGKGQLAQAVAILDDLNVQGVDVCSIAKARTESDFESAEVKSSSERIFIPGRSNPVILKPHTAACKLLTHCRDEAHRFAVQFHRDRRSKRYGL